MASGPCVRVSVSLTGQNQIHKGRRYSNKCGIMEIANYQTDLVQKQQLLEKASETIDNLTSKYSEELGKEMFQIQMSCADKVKEANKRVCDLEEDVQNLVEVLNGMRENDNGANEQLQVLTANLGDRNREVVCAVGCPEERVG